MDKRFIGRFCIQFNSADARHVQVVEILEAQGRRKAQFIAEAVLHYANCSESPEIKPQQNPAMLRKIIEGVVRECLHNEKEPPAAPEQADNLPVLAEVPDSENLRVFDGELDADLLASIQESMGTLRNEDE